MDEEILQFPKLQTFDFFGLKPLRVFKLVKILIGLSSNQFLMKRKDDVLYEAFIHSLTSFPPELSDFLLLQ